MLSQDKEYQSLKEGLVQEAIEEELGDDFVGEVEDKLLKLLTSGKEHQVNIVRKNLDPLVAAEFLSIAEQQAILNIYSDLLNGDIPQAQVTAVAFVASTTTELGKLMASDIQEYVDKSTCDQEGSNSENVGGAIGALGGAAWGGVAGAAGGAIFTGGPGVLAGALGGAGVGASVGNAVGKAIGGLLGGLFGGNDGPDDGGECGGDDNDGGDADG